MRDGAGLTRWNTIITRIRAAPTVTGLSRIKTMAMTTLRFPDETKQREGNDQDDAVA
jgi:hypothetical protein